MDFYWGWLDFLIVSLLAISCPMVTVLLCWIFILISLSLTSIHYERDKGFSVGVYDIEGVLSMAYGW